MLEYQIASRIKSLRNNAGLTLEELAGRTGLSKGHLSKVENQRLSPSISSLAKIAQGLGVPVGSFFDQKQLPPPPLSLVRKGERQLTAGPVNTTEPYAFYSLTKIRRPKMLRPLLVLFSGAAGEEQEAAGHAGEEFLFLLKGRLKFTSGREEYILEPGDAVHFQAGVPHKAVALDGQPAECLVIIGSMT